MSANLWVRLDTKAGFKMPVHMRRFWMMQIIGQAQLTFICIGGSRICLYVVMKMDCFNTCTLHRIEYGVR